jgi:hypothetical protein
MPGFGTSMHFASVKIFKCLGISTQKRRQGVLRELLAHGMPLEIKALVNSRSF